MPGGRRAATDYFATVLGQQVPPGRYLVVYDLGAGTFDVAAVRPSPAGFDVIAAAGLADVGGLDLDAAVVSHARTLTAAAEAWKRLDWPQTPTDRQARHTLWRTAHAVKEQLSRHTTADLHLPLIATDLHLTRDEFDKAARAHLERTTTLTLATLREAGIPREEIAGVFLVGGGSRIPLAATLLHRTLGIAPTALDQPELVVAEGALHTDPRTGSHPSRPAEPITAAPADPPPVQRATAGSGRSRVPTVEAFAIPTLTPPPAGSSSPAAHDPTPPPGQPAPAIRAQHGAQPRTAATPSTGRPRPSRPPRHHPRLHPGDVVAAGSSSSARSSPSRSSSPSPCGRRRTCPSPA